MKFKVTRDNERLLALLKRLGKVPQHLQHLTGVNLSEVVYDDGTPDVCLILGSALNGQDGRRPQAIPLAKDRSLRPSFDGNRIYSADVALDGDTYQLVKPTSEDHALRIITTGLLVNPRDGSTTRDFMDLAEAGSKLRYHGVFPITADAAEIIGEGIEGPVTAQSKVVFDERFGKIKNLAGVPKSREVTVQGVIGGPILVGQVDGVLKIHELTKNGWTVHDVTGSQKWQQKFMDLAEQDIEFLMARAKDERQMARRNRFKQVKPAQQEHAELVSA